MTGRERILRAASAIAQDRKPEIAWPPNLTHGDARIFPTLASLQRATSENADWAKLILVESPGDRILEPGAARMGARAANPESDANAIEQLAEAVEREIRTALESGADGIAYLVSGASEERCTPMAYGGLFLEHDRRLLAGAEGAALNVLFVFGGAGAFVDLFADLPAHIFAWSAKESGFSVRLLRALRNGLLCSDDPEADILLAYQGGPAMSSSAKEAAQLHA